MGGAFQENEEKYRITRVIILVLFEGGWGESHVIKWQQQRAKQTSMVVWF